MTPTVAIVAPGSMGSGVARRLTENKVTVLTTLKGRSEASVARAREAGMKDVDERQLMEADFFLSIVPPGQAMALAKHFAPLLSATNRKPLYADCNAMSPPRRGGRRRHRGHRRALRRWRHHRRPAARRRLTRPALRLRRPVGGRDGANAHGLDVRVTPGPVGAASALKMSYAGITKGFSRSPPRC